MAWWPFGRKKRKALETEKTSTATNKVAVPSKKSLSSRQPQQRVSSSAQVLGSGYQVDVHPALRDQTQSPDFIAFPEYTEKTNIPPLAAASSPIPIPPATPSQVHSQGRQVLRQPSHDYGITALPQSPRKRTPTPPANPPLRPVRETNLNIAAKEPSLVRRKSNKRHTESRSREEEVKAMTQSMPIPKRAGADSPQHLRRESKKRRSKAVGQFQDPSSVTSFQGHSSVRSSMTGVSESHRIDVGLADILSPRPTLRYSIQAAPGAQRSSAPSPSESKRPISKRTIRDGDRIDEYADGMDNRTLRELMDRDLRRSERKRKGEDDRAKRRLERYAARGEAEEAARRAAPRRNIFDDQEAGPSGETKEYQIQQDQQKRYLTQPTSPGNPFEDPSNLESRSPLVETHPALRSTNMEPVPTVAYTGHPSPPASPAHRRVPSNLSQVTDSRTRSMQDVSETASYGRRDSQPSVKRGGALAALFRRSGLGGRRTSAPAPPSERSFSNTSRESMSRATPPPQLPTTLNRPLSNTGFVLGSVPKRTRSKFREDLPESPISPPDSRYQSPEPGEHEGVPPLPTDLSMARLVGAGYVAHGSRPAAHSHSDSYESAGGPNPDLLSRSLASVDSEASWLASGTGGRPKKRTSQQMSIGRSSLRQPLEASPDDLGTPRESMGDEDVLNPFEEEDEVQVVQGTISRRPTIVHRSQRVNSQEGLLNQFGSEQSPIVTPSDAEYYETASEMESPDVHEGQVATFDQIAPIYGLQHARSISAGSAKLLDIPPRPDQSNRASRANPGPTTPPLHGTYTPTGL